jgi:hypothetical protein
MKGMKSGFAHYLLILMVHLGGLGQLVLGVMDSSFLFMPLGNDLLMIVLRVDSTITTRR